MLLLVVLSLLVVLPCAWWTWQWATASRAPDVRTADLGTVIGFLGSEHYSRMYQSARANYARGVADRLSGALLERFYARPAGQRSFLLSIVARGQESQARHHPQRFAGPSPDQLRAHLFRELSHHPPRVQAMRAQFASDLRAQRLAMGLLPDPG
jgi:hypothetical protein